MNAGGVQQARAALLNDCGDVETPEELQTTAEQREKVARLIAGWPGHDTETATELMLMLGVHPHQRSDHNFRETVMVPVSRVMR